MSRRAGARINPAPGMPGEPMPEVAPAPVGQVGATVCLWQGAEAIWSDMGRLTRG
jgi:hypothetical protein